MEEEQVSYETLQELLRAERRSNRVMAVHHNLWADVRAYLHELQDEFRDAQATDPFGRRVLMLTDQVKNAKAAARGIWELRTRKLATVALAGRDDERGAEGATAEEKQLLATMRDAIRLARKEVFADTQGRPIPKPPARNIVRPNRAQPAAEEPAEAEPVLPPPVPEEEPVPEQPTPKPAITAAAPEPAVPEPAPSPEPAAAEAPKPKVIPTDRREDDDALTIRALADLPPFVGPDMRTYQLQRGDIASVPPGIADLLLKRAKAVLVEID